MDSKNKQITTKENIKYDVGETVKLPDGYTYGCNPVTEGEIVMITVTKKGIRYRVSVGHGCTDNLWQEELTEYDINRCEICNSKIEFYNTEL